MIISIDYSLNSTGITIKKDDKFINLAIVNKRSIKSMVFDIIKDSKDLKLVIHDTPAVKSVKKSGLVNWQRDHIEKSMIRNRIYLDTILRYCKEMDIDIKSTKWILENYSYGSATDNLIQMCESTMLLKDGMLKNGFLLENFYVVAAPTVKKWVGNGNYTKAQLLEKYVEDNNNRFNDFYDIVKTNKNGFIKSNGKDVESPISDVIDSHFIMRWFMSNILHQQ